MDACTKKCIHKKTVAQVRARLPHRTHLLQIAEIFKALGDPGRLMVVAALLQDELCVCDLAALSGLSESAVSHQLRMLRHLRIVSNRREGKIVYYRLTDDHVRQLACSCIEHVVMCDTQQGTA